MAEYVMGPDENQEEVSRSLLDHAGPDRASELAWFPRAGVPGGGVFFVPDDLADGISSSRVFRVDDADAGVTGGDEDKAHEQEPTSARSRRAQAKATQAKADEAKAAQAKADENKE